MQQPSFSLVNSPLISQMMQSPIWLCFIWVGLASCHRPYPSEWPSTAPTGVYVLKQQGKFRLYRNGEPFFVKGACTVGTTFLPALAAAGGNTIRTYPGDDLDEILALADSLGLAVIAGLDMPAARFGVNYQDSTQRALIQAQIKAQVLRYKDAPALLMWGIGNEVPLLADEQTEVIHAFIDQLSQMIHELDSLHPTTYMVNGPEVALSLYRQCPDLDIISINAFSSLPQLQQVFKYGDWAFEKPVLISEWAPKGYWNAPVTAWSAPLEWNSEEKVNAYRQIYTQYLQPDSRLLLGSCIFIWGQKQEQTHTWFSLFSEQGKPLSIVDEMALLWTGAYPPNRAPAIEAILIDGQRQEKDTYLDTERQYQAKVVAHDPENDSLVYSWEITREYKRGDLTGGDREVRPPALPHLLQQQDSTKLWFKAPAQPGAYRLYAYVSDPAEKVAAFNLPFYVLRPAQFSSQRE
jgi:hypothetical protein